MTTMEPPYRSVFARIYSTRSKANLHVLEETTDVTRHGETFTEVVLRKDDGGLQIVWEKACGYPIIHAECESTSESMKEARQALDDALLGLVSKEGSWLPPEAFR